MFTGRRFFFGIILVTLLITGAEAATLHGAIYEWSDFEKPFKNTIVEINSTPAQYMVAITGTYSFNLSPGGYLIRAKYYRNNILEYAGEEEIRIDREGDFVHDLLLFPPTDSEYEYLGDINLTADLDIKSEYDFVYYIIISVLVLSVLTILYYIKKKKGISKEPITKEQGTLPPGSTSAKSGELPDDLREIYEMILKKGGRTTQKELRKELRCSEAKVSLMIADLEDRGLIKKIKKGRANIIIAQDQKS